MSRQRGQRGRSIGKSSWSKAISLTPWTRREQGRRRQARFQLGEEAGPKHELWGLKQINDEDVVNYFTPASRRLNYYHRTGLPRPDMPPSKAVQRSLGGFVFGGSFTNDLPAGLQCRTRKTIGRNEGCLTGLFRRFKSFARLGSFVSIPPLRPGSQSKADGNWPFRKMTVGSSS
jgi:hypothetical protein